MEINLKFPHFQEILEVPNQLKFITSDTNTHTGGTDSEAMNMNFGNVAHLPVSNSNTFTIHQLTTLSRATQVDNHAGNYPKAFGLVLFE